MEIGEVWLSECELFNKVSVCRNGIIHAHIYSPGQKISRFSFALSGVRKLTLEFGPRTESEGSSLRADSRHYRVNDFKSESSTVLNRAAILIRSVVGDILNELIDEVAVRSMNFHSASKVQVSECL